MESQARFHFKCPTDYEAHELIQVVTDITSIYDLLQSRLEGHPEIESNDNFIIQLPKARLLIKHISYGSDLIAILSAASGTLAAVAAILSLYLQFIQKKEIDKKGNINRDLRRQALVRLRESNPELWEHLEKYAKQMGMQVEEVLDAIEPGTYYLLMMRSNLIEVTATNSDVQRGD